MRRFPANDNKTYVYLSARHIHIHILHSASIIRGELGYFRIETGHNSLGIEGEVVWGTPGTWTVENVPCFESGKNCGPSSYEPYVDPSVNLDLIARRLKDPRTMA